MKKKVYNLKINFLTLVKEEDNSNVDVIVLLNNKSYIATFMTFKNLMNLLEIYKKTGECLYGTYFYSTRTIYIEKLTEDLIKKVVADMLEEGGFYNTFEECPVEEDE